MTHVMLPLLLLSLPVRAQSAADDSTADRMKDSWDSSSQKAEFVRAFKEHQRAGQPLPGDMRRALDEVPIPPEALKHMGSSPKLDDEIRMLYMMFGKDKKTKGPANSPATGQLAHELLEGAKQATAAVGARQRPAAAGELLPLAADLARSTPDSYVLPAAVAETYSQQEDYPSAYQNYDLAIQRGDDRADTYYGRGAAAEKLGDSAQANQDAAAALEREPEHPQALALFKLTRSAVPTVKVQDPRPALSEAQPAALVAELQSLAPKEAPEAARPARQQSADLIKAALSDVIVGGYPAAREKLAKAIEVDPTNPQPYYLRARMAVQTGDFEGAVKDTAEALRYSPESVALLNTRAMACNRMNRYQEALADASAVLKLNGKSALGWFNRAYARAGLGQRKEAMEDLRQAASLAPSLQGLLQKASELPADADLTLLLSGTGPAAGPAQGRKGRPRWPLYLVFALVSAFIAWRGLRGEESPTSDSLLGRYSVVRELAAGGMGVVYEAFDPGLQRKVAIKVMRTEIRMDERERERFLSEARTVAKMRHPNIVDIYAIEEQGSDAYLIFEYVEGKTLAGLLQDKGRLGLAEAKAVFRGVCAALEYAHERGIVHRDLKPSNIMIDKEGLARVMDFGVAREAKDAMDRLSVTRTVCGTPPYMAPEQEAGVVGRSTDTYALAVCLYECLTGRLPFEGAAVAKKLSGEYAPVSSLVPGLPKETDSLLARGLDPKPEKRFDSARGFLEALESLA